MGNIIKGLCSAAVLLGSSSAFALSATPSIVELQTNLGTITLQLDYQNAPISANNFADYVESGFYKDVLFHRVIKGFMIQGGGFSKLDGKPKATKAPITLESNNGLKNVTGTIAMARTSDPNSATAQFFINTVDNAFLDYTATNPGYAVFGTVVKGMNVVNKIADRFAKNINLLDSSTDSYGNPFYPLVDNVTNVDWVYIENAYLSDSLQKMTRVMIAGSGKVTSTPSGINCGTSCQAALSGQATLTATPAAGFVFHGWRGDCAGLSRIITIDTAKNNHNCTANFGKTVAKVQ